MNLRNPAEMEFRHPKISGCYNPEQKSSQYQRGSSGQRRSRHLRVLEIGKSIEGGRILNLLLFMLLKVH